MRHTYTILALAAMLMTATPAISQITLDESSEDKKNVVFKEDIRQTSIYTNYFSRARYKAERAAKRKRHNYLEITGGVQGTLTTHNEPWIETSGGDNSVAIISSMFLQHIYTKKLFTVETKINMRLGYNSIKIETTTNDITESEGIWFKTHDEFSIEVAPSFKMSKNWSYGSIFSMRSQFLRGYKSRTEQGNEHMKSGFMSPGYLNLSFGFTYKSPVKRFPLVINISPLAISGTYVSSKIIRDNNFLYGIEDPAKSSKYEGGSSVQIDFDRTFGKRGIFRYRTTIHTFMGWLTNARSENKYSDYSTFRQKYIEWEEAGSNIEDKPTLTIHPTLRWTNTIDIKATKYFATTLSFQMEYNRAQNIDVQTKTLLSVGLTYTFKNK